MSKLVNHISAHERPLHLRFRARQRYVAVPVTTIPNIVRWSFLLFVFSFPFEATDLGFMTGFLSISKVLGLLFLAFYFFYYSPTSPTRSFPRLPSPMWCFLGYVAVYVLSALFVHWEFFGTFLLRFATLIQVLVFFWVASDLLKDERMARTVLLTYTIAAVLFSVGVILRVPGFYEEITAGRATGAGENLNIVAMFMAIALVILTGLSLRTVYKGFMTNLLLISLAVPLMVAMVGTGSRGGVAAFIVGTSVYLLPYWKSKRTLAAIVLSSLGAYAVVYMIASNPDFVGRWQESYYEGKLSQRENIFSTTIEMISERPIVGWGPIESGYRLGFREGSWDWTDTHNLFLHLLVEVGLLGTIPFLVGLWICLRSAWKARSGNLGLLPLALLVTILTTNFSGTNLVWKPQWLVLALTIASASNLSRKLAKGSSMPLVAYPLKAGNRPYALRARLSPSRSNSQTTI